MLFDGRYSAGNRVVACVTATIMVWLSGPVNAFAKGRPVHKPVSRLAAKGLTQTPDVDLQKLIAAREAQDKQEKQHKAAHPQKDVEALSAREMETLSGRGPYRNAYFAGSPMPWHRSLRDVNLCTGNLFKSFTDLQVAPGRGAGLVLQRTYSSQDDREGPFGTGWTHAYDIRMDEAGADPDDADVEDVPRTDFFGGKHTYHRDADGLYSPPDYMFDELDSKYDEFLASGPSAPLEDVQKGMDGTVKHFIANGTNADSTPNTSERVCDTITDRHGNVTTLAYTSVTRPDGSTWFRLHTVTDPVGRVLTFTWSNLVLQPQLWDKLFSSACRGRKWSKHFNRLPAGIAT